MHLIKFALEDINNTLNSKELIDIVGYDILFSKNKSYIAKELRNYINKNCLYNIKEINQAKIILKIISVNENYECYDAISFPQQPLTEIIYEDWNSEIIEKIPCVQNYLLNHFIIVPIIKRKIDGNFDSPTNWRIGNFSIWHASTDELNNIRIEWEKAKEIIKNGVKIEMKPYGKGFRNENNLLKQSQSNYIHMRPHATNSLDIDRLYLKYTFGMVEICKQSFWFNKSFVNNILKNNQWIRNSKEE